MLYRERDRDTDRETDSQKSTEMQREMRDRDKESKTQSREETELIERDRQVVLTPPSLRDIRLGLCSALEAPGCVKSRDSIHLLQVAFLPFPARLSFAALIHQGLVKLH